MPQAGNAPRNRVQWQALAAAAGITPRQVRKDFDAGANVDSPEAYLAWRALNRVHQADSRSRGEVGLSINTETARLRRLQADREELEIAERRGELLDAEDVRQTVLAMNVVFASQLDALPGRMANELAAINNPAVVLAKLRDECNRIRDAVAAEFTRLASAAAARGERGEGSAQSDTGSVGRPNSQPSAGERGAGSVP